MQNVTLLDIKIEKARRNFWSFCNLLEPDFYKESRTHLKTLCDTLNDFHYNKLLKETGESYSKLMIRMPPQFGKTRTLVNFNKWSLGRNNEERIITGSYGDEPAGDMARYTRDGIQEEKNIPDQIVFSDIFPNCKIKQGNASYYKWALEGQHFNYLGVGVGGAVTGKGATLRIIDDLVKDAQVAMNKAALHKIWVWLSGTFSSRNAAEGGEVKEIFCATLWGKDDPQGILEKDEPQDWYILELEIYDENKDVMLCDEFMNKENYLKLKSRMLKDPVTSVIFWANYHNKKKKLEGMLYGNFKVYTELPKANIIYNYTDVADKGKDYLCSVSYIKVKDAAYIVDVYYSRSSNETTEPELAKRLKDIGVNFCKVESNAGGRAFKRNVERLSRELKNFKTRFIDYHQSANKESKILNNSSTVMNVVVMPYDWNVRWTVFYDDVTNFSILSSNENDDAPDVLSEIAIDVTRRNISL